MSLRRGLGSRGARASRLPFPASRGKPFSQIDTRDHPPTRAWGLAQIGKRLHRKRWEERRDEILRGFLCGLLISCGVNAWRTRLAWGGRGRRDVGAPSTSPWSAGVPPAVSCVSRETVLACRNPRPSAHLLAQAATGISAPRSLAKFLARRLQKSENILAARRRVLLNPLRV